MKKSLHDLLNEKKVIIPIIQRDYAQGRNNDKALAVRSRLIDDWKDILLSDNKQMDFNYVYGNENQENEFFPVDGQQRLTSLYLLYWYFSFCNSDVAYISKWSFEYKTRNSASEFFEFMKNTVVSNELFKIIRNKDGINKEEEIKDKNWFKIKWCNDPTITAAITFLILLSEKMEDLTEVQEKHIWIRLKETDITRNAIVFTYLPESNSDNPEVAAAKKYTRMNARGKKLTDFENLKAMIDEIESFINDEKPLSINYDKLYIHKLYNKFSDTNKSLENTVLEINKESLEWYKLVFFVYAHTYSLEVPTDLVSCIEESTPKDSDLFENRIYKISQKRIDDPLIKNYLIMIQAVQEVLYNSRNDDCVLYSSFKTLRTQIAFIVFTSKLWTSEKSSEIQQELNSNIFYEWKRFENCIQDLSVETWNVSYDKYIQILNYLCEGINNASKEVNKFFISLNNFDKELLSPDILPDLYARITEQQIKSSLLENKQITSFNELDELFYSQKIHRLGYFYYITGCLNEWEKNRDTISINKNVIQELREILLNIDFNSKEYLKAFAYASQCNENGLLKPKEEINSCDNSHIWNPKDLVWTDSDYQNCFPTKEKTLHNLQKLCNLLKKYIDDSSLDITQMLNNFINLKISEFDNLIGYESCWLRFALQSQSNTRELLSNELENPDGEVLIFEKNYILYCYLVESNYKESTDFDILRKQGQSIFSMDLKKFGIYGTRKQVLSFQANPEGEGKYKHSSRTDLDDLSGNLTTRNLILEYVNEIKYASDINKPAGTFYLDEHNNISISLYSLGEEKDKKRLIKISSTVIKADNYKSLLKKLELWEKEFSFILKSPNTDGNWDKWIELWYAKSAKTYQFTISNLNKTAEFQSSGSPRRPVRSWRDVTDLSNNLDWNDTTILI